MALMPEWTLVLGKAQGVVIHGRSCVSSEADVSTADADPALDPEGSTLIPCPEPRSSLNGGSHQLLAQSGEGTGQIQFSSQHLTQMGL